METRNAIERWLGKKCREWSFEVASFVKMLSKNWTRHFAEEIAAVGVADVEKLEEERANGRRSGSALNQERTYLRQLFRYAELHGWREKGQDPTATWKYRSTKVRRPYAPLTQEEEARLLAVAPEWLRRMTVLGICTNLRERALRGLTWGMLDEQGVLRVPAELIKTEDPRTIPLVPRALELLTPRGAPEEKILAGCPKSASMIWREFKRYGRQAGINANSTPHDLRRTFAQRLGFAKVPTHLLLKLGGWKTMSILVTHYTSDVPTDDARKLMENL